MQITFIAETLADLEQQIRAFLGYPQCPAPYTACPPALSPSARAVPDWAPPGSSWLAMPGAPVLLGPDGAAIPLRWDGATPMPGTIVHYSDPDAEAAGAALLASIRGG